MVVEFLFVQGRGDPAGAKSKCQIHEADSVREQREGPQVMPSQLFILF
jgi:hypothetical protein